MLGKEEMGSPPLTTAPDALTEYFAGSVVERREKCAGCGLANQIYHQNFRILVFPFVLVLTLKRWQFIDNGRGGFDERLLDHHVLPTKSLNVESKCYLLRSVVIRLGNSPRSCHYICVAKHDSAGGDWWLFNDERCV